MTHRNIKPILVTQTYPMRKPMLRFPNPHHEMDSARLALHLGAYAGEQLVGVASLFKAPMPLDKTRKDAWCVWGLVVENHLEEQGYKEALLQACIGYAAHNKGLLLWLKSNDTEAPFYAEHGFTYRHAPKALGTSNIPLLMMRHLSPDDARLHVEATFR